MSCVLDIKQENTFYIVSTN